MHRTILVFLIIGTAFLTLLGGNLFGSQHVIASLPYTASSSYDTLTLAGSKITSQTDGITVTGNNIVINLNGDTLAFGAGNGANNVGIRLGSPSHHIKVMNGTILQVGSGDQNRGVYLAFTHDILIENCDIIVGGTNGHCIDAASVGPPGNYNIEISGGNFWNNSHAYDSRCYYDGAAIRLWSSSWGGYGDYHFKVHDITLHTTPGQGIILSGRDQNGNEALVHAYNNDLRGDARNTFYDYCAPNCGTCLSSANPYLLALVKLAPGSKIYNNTFSSGDNYGGSRGILIESCLGTVEKPIEIYGNYLDLHEGPNHEYDNGFVQAVRIRSIDGGSHGHIYFHHNTVIGTADNNPATTATGTEVRCFFHSVQSIDKGHVVIESNTFTARALSAGTIAKAFVVESPSSVTNPGNSYRFNRIESNGTVVKLGDVNMPGNHVTLEQDTLAFITPSYTTPTTFNIGRYSGESIGNNIVDCIFTNGASDTNIVWTNCGNGDNEVTLRKNFTVTALGYNSLPVAGAAVTLTNNYGKTIGTSVTDYNGQTRHNVAYWFECEDRVDSTNYNNFTVKVKIGNDSSISYLNVGQTTENKSMVLANTEGETCDTCSFVCGDLSNNAIVNIMDIIYMINYLYLGGPAPAYLQSADVNADTAVNILDIIYLRNYIYINGPLPVCF